MTMLFAQRRRRPRPVRDGDRPPRSASALVLAAVALWGTTGTAQALAHAGDPVAVGAARLAVGGAALAVTALLLRGGPASVLACLRRPLLGWTLAAAVATAVYQSAFFSAVASTGVATGTVVALGTAPVATGLCAARVFREPLTASWALATALAVVGCGVLVLAGGAGSTVHPAGVGLAVLAGACYGVYTTAAKNLLDRGVPTVAAMGTTLGLGAVLLTPVLAAHASALATPRAAVLAAWLGLVTTAAAYLLYARGLRRLPAGTVGTLSLAEPLTAAGLGLLALHERPGPAAALGALTLLAGLVLALARPTRGGPPDGALADRASAHPAPAHQGTAHQGTAHQGTAP